MDKPGLPQPRIQIEDDHEGKMARSELYRAAKYAMKLFQMIQEGQELEGWVQSKITKSADYLDSVYHYMEYQMKFGAGAEATSVDDITGEASVVKQESSKDEGTDMKENLNYEQELKSLLEGAIKKLSKEKEKKKADKMEEGWDDMVKAGEKKKAEKGTGKFDVKKTSTGTQYTRKASTFTDGGDDKDVKKAKKKAKAQESTVKSVVRKVVEAKKKAKPDFLDVDKDGDKKEPMKKAVADKKKGAVKESIPANYKTSALKAAASKDRNADEKSGVPANYKTSAIKADLAKKAKVKESSDLTDILKLAGRRPLNG
jgi:hypothetical protein